MSTLAQFGTGEFLWSMLWFTLLFLWIWLVIMVFIDIIRSDDLGGGGKALWLLFVIVLPYLGVFVYLIARGREMAVRRTVASSTSHSAETIAAQQASAKLEQS
jgi:hypothetical protein